MLSLFNKQITETLQFTYSGLPITRPLKEVKKKVRIIRSSEQLTGKKEECNIYCISIHTVRVNFHQIWLQRIRVRTEQYILNKSNVTGLRGYNYLDNNLEETKITSGG